VQDAGIQGSRDTGIHGYRDTWIQMQRYTDEMKWFECICQLAIISNCTRVGFPEESVTRGYTNILQMPTNVQTSPHRPLFLPRQTFQPRLFCSRVKLSPLPYIYIYVHFPFSSWLSIFLHSCWQSLFLVIWYAAWLFDNNSCLRGRPGKGGRGNRWKDPPE